MFPTAIVSTATLLLIAVTSNASSTMRGQQPPRSRSLWSVHPTDTGRRLLPLETNTECLLLLKDIDYEDHANDEDQWSCAFTYERAVQDLNGREIVDIDVPKDVIDAMHPTSGASILKTHGAYIEESIHTHEMRMHIPDAAAMEVVTVPETDTRHYKARRLLQQQHRRRHLISSNPDDYTNGEMSVLVLRVVDANQAAPAEATQLRDDIFEDDFSLKTGYEQCSQRQVNIVPADGTAAEANGEEIIGGIATIAVNVAASAGRNTLQQEALAVASTKFGDLSANFDLVMVCQPPGSGTWLAYAYINGYLSFYNDAWCQSVSAQMHEVGHNLGLGHSNHLGTAYGDQSSMMGYSYPNDDGPKMCFNAVKNFQLGWYERMQATFNPFENMDETVSFTLQGVNEYKTTGNTQNKLITLRIVEFGDDYDAALGDYGSDYYVGFNHATGPNTGTLEAPNQVVLFRKATGGPAGYGESDRIADLSVGRSFKLDNFQDRPIDVTIRVKAITGTDAIIEITTLSDGVPTQAPTASCGGRGRFQLELDIDTYAYETAWELIENETNEVLYSVGTENHNLSKHKYVYPLFEENIGDYYCLEESKCYTYRITDTYGDGLNFGEGSYTGYLDDAIAFVGDGDFDTEMNHVFCVEEEGRTNDNTGNFVATEDPTPAPVVAPTNVPTPVPTLIPTMNPTLAPTQAPTTPSPTTKPTKAPTAAPPVAAPTIPPAVPQCTDDPDFLWKGRAKKDCVWVGKGKDSKTIKKCKRNNGDGKRVYDYCPMVCALHNQGPCK